MTKCQLTVAPFYQCCCRCRHHLPVHYHCTTVQQPTEEQKKVAGGDGRCVCGVQKGWACVLPEHHRVYDNWPEHGCGCELYEP